MKNKFLIASALTLLTSFLFSQGYSINGKIKGLHNTVCYFGNHYGNKQYIKDTAKVDNEGNFVFQGKEKLPGGIYLVVPPSKKYFEIIIDKEQNFSFETDTTTKMIANMKIIGSEDNIMFYKYLNYIAGHSEKDKQIYQNNIIKDHPSSFLSVIFKAQKDPVIPETPLLPNKELNTIYPH